MTAPFTEEEFETLKTELNSIKTFLPDNKMSYIWTSVQKIRDKKTPQPCSCRSSAKLWAKAVSDLREFVNERTDK